MDVVPTWDGNTDHLARLLLKVNLLTKRSSIIFLQLGSVVPQRFRGNTENCFYSLPEDTRDAIQSNWNTLKKAIRAHYMNRHWLDRQKEPYWYDSIDNLGWIMGVHLSMV